MARPTKDEADRKTHVFRIRMTKEDRDTIEAAANLEGRGTSQWARQVLLRSAKRKGTIILRDWIRAQETDEARDETSSE